ncbi:MAG TPA: TonB-dependent receptor [Pyrinomonadaceae bacterium]|nr:TonB-dependent receptor [Pyrinomonadaceae bacterium]
MKKNIKFFALAIFAVVSLFFVTATMAQTSTTGSVEGVVTDANGAVVPNAAITLSGPNVIRALTTTSDSDGAYRFTSVPPGRYSVEVAAVAGFAAYKQENIEVNLSRATAVNVTLQAGTSATIDVVASAEIDQTTNTTGSNISTEFFSNIPTSRTVQGLYTIAPTVARSGLRDASGRDRDPSVAGSSGPENSYILDGVNTTDPAFGGGGANLPFEFVQEVQIKTGAFGADQGLSTGGVFNVITKTGGNEFHGDIFAYGLPDSFVQDTKNLPFTGLAPNGYSELDAGGDIGGPIIKNKLTFFAAFNPQFRTNNYLTQTFHDEAEGKIKTPFYSGKLSWLVNNNNTLTFSTFGDFTKEEGHLFAGSGFGANPASFLGIRETGGHNYSARLNSNITQNMIGEFAFGLHFQQNNVIPDASVASTALIADSFAILRGDGTVAPVTQTNTTVLNCTPVGDPPAPPAGCGAGPTASTYNGNNTGFADYVFSPGGLLQRGFIQDGFGLYQDQSRDRWEASARLQNIVDNHTIKYGFEFYRNSYDIFQTSTGPSQTYANPLNVSPTAPADWRSVNGYRVTNNFSVCTTRGTVITCPSATAIAILRNAPLPVGYTLNDAATAITAAEALNNPFLVRTTTRVRDFTLNAQTETDVESFYVQDDWRVMRNLQFNLGVRWDYQQARGNEGVSYLKLNDWFHNLQPRLGFSWDPWGKGGTKIFANYARFVETPIPLDVNVRAGSENSQTDKNFNVNRLNAPANATVATGFAIQNLGSHPTPIDAGLKPQTVNEWTIGFEHQFWKNFTFGTRGIYRAQGSVIEDGSFDDGENYFLFNPGESLPPGPGGPAGNTEYQACTDFHQCFGRARRFYRGLEFTLNRRFADNYAFQASYVYSSLIGNYEGLFRNDNGQSDPNITSLFDLTSLLEGTYGRLPNDRPHQFKFNGTYQTPWKLVVSGNFYIQSGIPYNKLVPHTVYGNNEGFCRNDLPGGCNPRGTSTFDNDADGAITAGNNRTPTTWNLDIGAYYPIKFSEDMQLRITADWFNVTNTQRAVTVDQTLYINSGVTGVAPVLNPFSGTGAIFQYPSAIRLGAKFSF